MTQRGIGFDTLRQEYLGHKQTVANIFSLTLVYFPLLWTKDKGGPLIKLQLIQQRNSTLIS